MRPGIVTDRAQDLLYRALHIGIEVDYRPPAPEAIQVLPRDPGYAMLRQDLWLDLSPILT